MRNIYKLLIRCIIHLNYTKTKLYLMLRFHSFLYVNFYTNRIFSCYHPYIIWLETSNMVLYRCCCREEFRWWQQYRKKFLFKWRIIIYSLNNNIASYDNIKHQSVSSGSMTFSTFVQSLPLHPEKRIVQNITAFTHTQILSVHLCLHPQLISFKILFGAAALSLTTGIK